ncbi:O-antigen translocase [Providencia rettgeri]|uniref:O-antigen translocase n=1 Tax=Providencia rettgeri TaxID=587 RepID=UPI001E36270F|nr:O-antigen translocase [Providencia rettgeri]
MKSSAIIGGASVITIIISLVKVKFLAVMLGPDGIGTMGMLLTFLTLGSSLFGLGIGTIGVREIAYHSNDPQKIEQIRIAIFLANLLLGSLGLALITYFSSELSIWLFGIPDQEWNIFLLGLGVFISLIYSSQSVVLQGFRKINELARIKIYSALISAILGLSLVFYFSQDGITGFIILVPICSCLLSIYYCSLLPKVKHRYINIKTLIILWKGMIYLGFIYMLSGFMSEGTKLLTRDIIKNNYSLVDVGYFQAAWAISMTYITFILGAMATDYYPRLSSLINNKIKSNELINDQLEVALTFSAPVLLVFVSFSPLIISMLYTKEFEASIEILRWQIQGDILKIAAWPLGFLILANNKGKMFFSLELLWNLSYILIIYYGLIYFELRVTGYAFFISYILYFFACKWSAKKISGFSFNIKNIKILILLFSSSLLITLSSYISEWIAIIIGSICIVISIFYILKSLKSLDINNGKIKKITLIINKVFSK